jgi:hypothetical protein
LKCYKKSPNNTFWNSFPKNTKKKTCYTPINVEKLSLLVNENSSKWSHQQKTIAKRAINILRFGSKICFIKGAKVKYNSQNGNSSFKHGRLITDTIATWVKKGHVIGPFSTPPFFDLNISPLMAIEQKTKVRPILNLSAPEGSSLNDAVDKIKLRKLTMSSAKKFSQTLLKLGRNAKFAKSDLVDAYKLIPIHPCNWKYYGFKWLGKFFVDTTTPFGSNTAPANFDDVGETVMNIVQTICNTPKILIHRQLDDVPVISPECSDLANQFSSTYKKICKSLNIEMAPNCIHKDKAFDVTTKGIVLGIEFNSENLTWKLPATKWNDSIWMINEFLKQDKCTLLELQKLHGKINDFAQICPFVKGFRFHQNKTLQEFEISNSKHITISLDLKKELNIWKNCIADSVNSYPIPNLSTEIPIFYKENFSDAAGASFDSHNSINPVNDVRGAAAITLKNRKVKQCTTVSWPYNFISKYPHNSSLLEIIGLIIPFIAHPKVFATKYVKCNVDNISLLYAWENKTSKNDQILYEMIKLLHIIEVAIPCKIFIDHSPRRSSWQTILVDNLSRKHTTTEKDVNLILKAEKFILDGPLKNWIENPTKNIDTIAIIDDLIAKM